MNSKIFFFLSERSIELPTFWIFPYFFEPRILQSSPGFAMLDYQVSAAMHISSNAVYYFLHIKVKKIQSSVGL